MPLSQVVIPVSRIPTSCSFYLATLTPLGYQCLGYQGKAIAFGTDEVEFFLHQYDSIVGHDPVKLTFAASSRRSVDKFFQKALLAGGSSQSCPCEGVDENPYYRAVVGDLDGNHIGAMYRPATDHTLGSSLRVSDAQRISKWQSDVASRSEDHAGCRVSSTAPRIIVNNITTTPTVQVRRVQQEVKEDGEISTRAIIGTLLGASAGVAVAYAMAKSEGENAREAEQQRTAYRAIEARPQKVTEIIHNGANPPSSQPRPIQLIDREANDSMSHHSNPQSRVRTMVPSYHSATTSHTGRTIAQTSGTKILTANAERPSSISCKLDGTTARRPENVKASGLVPSTVTRSAKDVPLPASRVSSSHTAASKKEETLNDLATVLPDESISQVSTKRSSAHPRRSGHQHHHHHHHHNKSGHTSKHSGKGSHGSDKTVKASENHTTSKR